MKRSFIGGVTFFVMLAACSSVVVDTTLDAVAAGDYTLAATACEAVPGHGMDICRVRAGTAIESAWRMVIPYAGPGLLQSGEVDIYYRDIHRQYPITSSLVEIPWADFFGQTVWSPALDGEALALVQVRWVTPQGIQEIVRYRGIAKIVVTQPGYDRLPIDSGFAAWKTTCKIQYSTAGRGALLCQ